MGPFSACDCAHILTRACAPVLDTWYAIRDDAIDLPLDDFYIDVHTLASEAQFPTRAAIRGAPLAFESSPNTRR